VKKNSFLSEFTRTPYILDDHLSDKTGKINNYVNEKLIFFVCETCCLFERLFLVIAPKRWSPRSLQ
jgi:hypothetical protein